MMVRVLQTLALLISCSVALTFSPGIYRQASPAPKSEQSSQRKSSVSALDIELPDVTEIFEKIQQVSPLARSVIEGNDSTSDHPALKWKTVESNKKSTVQEIHKLEAFGGISTPVFRFRSKLQGPCIGEFFGRFIIDLEERRKWDAQVENVHELHSIDDLDAIKNAMHQGGFGECSQFGIGYGQTKKAFGIAPREQMFIYGMQEFTDGSSLLWGTEMSEEHNHLLPPGQRHTRAKSHLFSATLRPSANDSFDVEYVLQLDIGGSIPSWLTTPVLIDNIKTLFTTAQKDFAGATDSLQNFLMQKGHDESFAKWESLLIPI